MINKTHTNPFLEVWMHPDYGPRRFDASFRLLTAMAVANLLHGALPWCSSTLVLFPATPTLQSKPVLPFSQAVCRCYGFAWQGFRSRGAIGVASVRSCEKLPPRLIKPILAGCKMDPPLAKAKRTSDSGSASGITYLGGEEKNSG